MIVIVDDSVFASRDADELAALLRISHDKPYHRIQTDPPWDPAQSMNVNRWLAEQSQSLREKAELTLRSGIEDDVLGLPLEIRIRIVETDEPDWNRDPPLLPLDEARRLLERPLRLMLEDEESDGAFLKTVPPRHWRAEFQKALEKHWLEIEHGGGIPRMLPRLKERSRQDILRLWVLFDSDAREPPEPGKPVRASEESQEICRLCQVRSIACHQLRRRAAENYLPLQALSAWIESPRSQDERARNEKRRARKELRRTYLAFKRMSREQRHHYDMKSGFSRDQRTAIPTSFTEHAKVPELQSGFGRSVYTAFKQEHFTFHEEWLIRDGQQEETTRMILSILRRL